MPQTRTPILVVLGATGAGKSQLALDLAQKFGGEVISADAMQMYKGLDIVTNKVTAEERSLVKHHMIDFLDPMSTHNVVDFRNMAVPIVDDLLQRRVVPVICGGTNYYIESLIWKILVEEGAANDSGEDVSTAKRQKIEDEENGPSTADLYRRLQEVDPERASEIHPNERRKIARSLEVFERHNRKHSEILAEQRSQDGGGLMGGPLRYPDVAVFWVQCEQSVLDDRCNRRVDKMIELGMINELEQFHKDYNSKRSQPDYTVGIFQSIGFKEFHEYLMLDEDKKKSDIGQKLFAQGVEQLKIVTRQYARRQLKWIRMRFLNPKRICPPVYAFDSTDPSRWNDTARDPAFKVVESLMSGEVPSQQPLPLSCETLFGYEEKRKVFHCDVCDRDMKGSIQYEAHIKSRKHQTAAKHKARQEAEKLEAKLRREAKEAKKDEEQVPIIETPIEDTKDAEESKS